MTQVKVEYYLNPERVAELYMQDWRIVHAHHESNSDDNLFIYEREDFHQPDNSPIVANNDVPSRGTSDGNFGAAMLKHALERDTISDKDRFDEPSQDKRDTGGWSPSQDELWKAINTLTEANQRLANRIVKLEAHIERIDTH